MLRREAYNLTLVYCVGCQNTRFKNVKFYFDYGGLFKKIKRPCDFEQIFLPKNAKNKKRNKFKTSKRHVKFLK